MLCGSFRQTLTFLYNVELIWYEQQTWVKMLQKKMTTETLTYACVAKIISSNDSVCYEVWPYVLQAVITLLL